MMTHMASHARWQKAQTYEKSFWNTFAGTLVAQNAARLDWYKERALQITIQAQPFLKEFSKVRALEIGSGPIGIINYLEFEERLAIDPLEDYYKTEPDLIRSRDARVHYYNGTGEDISSLGKTFSFIIIDNVLDHVKEPQRVLGEIHKNLEPGAIMFISLNVYTPWGVRLRNVLELFQLDRGHPFNFSEHSITVLLQGCGFEVLLRDTEDYNLQKKRYRRSKQLKKKIKSFLGLTDYRFNAFCRKSAIR